LRRYTFFFSSRRRHTRFSRDWSSDVCSSDLLDVVEPQSAAHVEDRGPRLDPEHVDDEVALGHQRLRTGRADGAEVIVGEELLVRSEERRVGKEYRSRKSPNQ